MNQNNKDLTINVVMVAKLSIPLEHAECSAPSVAIASAFVVSLSVVNAYERQHIDTAHWCEHMMTQHHESADTLFLLIVRCLLLLFVAIVSFPSRTRRDNL